jgi:hypothetical protein
LTSPETSLLDKSLEYNDVCSWKRIPGTVSGSVEVFLDKLSGGSAWGKAVAVIDASAGIAFSNLWHNMSHERIQDHILKNGAHLLRREIVIPDSHSKIMMVTQKFPGALDNRIFSIVWSWRREADGTFTLAFEDSDKAEHFGDGTAKKQADQILTSAAKAVKASASGFYRIEPRAPDVCKVTLVMQGIFGGSIPLLIGNMSAKSHLDVVARLQTRYERRGRLVDEEIRDSYQQPPFLENLTEEQRDVAVRCRILEDHFNDDASLTELVSPSPFVSMWIAHTPAKGWERHVALGKATFIADFPARKVHAWWFHYCSRERLRRSMEEGNPARIVWRENSSHDNVVTTIKKLPFPLHNREFVQRQLCAVDSQSGACYIFAVPDNAVVDYGSNFNVVRGTSSFMVKTVPLDDSQCRVTFLVSTDPKGRIPSTVVNSKIFSTLANSIECREQFQRDEELDEEKRNVMARIIQDRTQVYTSHEIDVVEQLKQKESRFNNYHFEALASPDPLVEMSHTTELDGVGIGKAVTEVDASIEDCAAWELSSMTRESTRIHHERKGLDRSWTEINEHSNIYRLVVDLHIPGFQPREWVLRQIWKWEDEDSKQVLEVYADNVDLPDIYPINPKYVRAKASPYLRYEKLEPVGGVPRTRVTYFQGIDLGGAIPVWLMNKGAAGQLMKLHAIRMRFDRSLDIDFATRARIVEKIMGHNDAYSADEDRAVAGGMARFGIFASNNVRVNKVDAVSPLCQNEISHIQGDRLGWGRSKVTVRACLEDILAYHWDFMARHLANPHTIEKELVEEVNAHNIVVHAVKVLPEPFSDRDLVMRWMWKKLDENTFIFVIEPVSHAKYPENKRVRARFPAVIKLRRAGVDKTRVDYLLQLDIGGNDHGRVISAMIELYLKQNLRRTYDLHSYFQAIRGLEQWDADDGKSVGEIMVVKTKEESHHKKGETKVGARMRLLFKKQRGLRSIDAKHEFFQAMMVRVLENKLRPAGDVGTKLCSVSLKEGRKIGAGLATSLASNLTAETAVDEWISKYPALKELDREEIWFRPMVNIVAKRLLAGVSWGLKFRVYSAAALSVLDLGSDVNVILLYLSKHETKEYGLSLLSMLSACMLLQMCIVFAQNRTRPARMFKEVLIVLTGLKPGERRAVISAIHGRNTNPHAYPQFYLGFDAYRVASGGEAEEGGILDPQIELTATKLAELFGESIPGKIFLDQQTYLFVSVYSYSPYFSFRAGCILQIYVILQTGDWSNQAVASIIISAMTAGMVSASISYDFDVDPARRKATPEFYGYIPDGLSRSLTFVCMMASSFLILLLRSFVAALLMIMDIRYFFWFSACDMAVYLIQKIFRRDFWHWVPIDGAFGLFQSIALRITIKTVTDYTGNIQFRGSGEMGGLYWSFNMTMAAIIVPFAAVKFYYSETKPDSAVMEERMAWQVVRALSGTWLAVFVLFLKLMKKEYWRTFISTETGFEWAQKLFLFGETDAKRAGILGFNRKQWTSIEADVKVWVLDGWEGWEEDEPGWFTQDFKASVDEDWLPPAELTRQRVAGGGQRRTTYFSKLMVGGRRGSATVVPTDEDVEDSSSLRQMSSIEDETDEDFFPGIVTGMRSEASATWGSNSTTTTAATSSEAGHKKINLAREVEACEKKN